jgi:hypothetical protein
MKTDSAEDYKVILGKQKRDTAIKECNEQRLNVRKFLVHPRFNPHQLSNDIALCARKFRCICQFHFLSQDANNMCLVMDMLLQ